MPALSPRRFKTLAEANEFFAKSQSPPTARPVPKLPERPPNPDPSVGPPEPTPPGIPSMSLNNLPPKPLATYMENLTGPELAKFLLKEPSDTPAYHAAYREICKRRRI